MTNELFRSAEKHVLYNELEACNRSAVILPFSEIRDYFVKLKKQGTEFLYIGKDVLGKENGIGFFLSGWVPDRILMRVQAVRSAGIWERMSDIHSITHAHLMQQNYIATSAQVVRPTMEGNILVIFFVLLVGIGASTLIFVVEIRNSILNCVFVVFSNLKVIYFVYIQSLINLRNRKGAWNFMKSISRP